MKNFELNGQYPIELIRMILNHNPKIIKKDFITLFNELYVILKMAGVKNLEDVNELSSLIYRIITGSKPQILEEFKYKKVIPLINNLDNSCLILDDIKDLQLILQYLYLNQESGIVSLNDLIIYIQNNLDNKYLMTENVKRLLKIKAENEFSQIIFDKDAVTKRQMYHFVPESPCNRMILASGKRKWQKDEYYYEIEGDCNFLIQWGEHKEKTLILPGLTSDLTNLNNIKKMIDTVKEETKEIALKKEVENLDEKIVTLRDSREKALLALKNKQLTELMHFIKAQNSLMNHLLNELAKINQTKREEYMTTPTSNEKIIAAMDEVYNLVLNPNTLKYNPNKKKDQ